MESADAQTAQLRAGYDDFVVVAAAAADVFELRRRRCRVAVYRLIRISAVDEQLGDVTRWLNVLD